MTGSSQLPAKSLLCALRAPSGPPGRLVDLHVPLVVGLELLEEGAPLHALLRAHALQHLLDACTGCQRLLSGQLPLPMQTGPRQAQRLQGSGPRSMRGRIERLCNRQLAQPLARLAAHSLGVLTRLAATLTAGPAKASYRAAVPARGCAPGIMPLRPQKKMCAPLSSRSNTSSAYSSTCARAVLLFVSHVSNPGPGGP